MYTSEKINFQYFIPVFGIRDTTTVYTTMSLLLIYLLTLSQGSEKTGPLTENNIYSLGNDVRDDKVTFPKL